MNAFSAIALPLRESADRIPSRNAQAGFTFAEVLAAMLFVAIVIPVALHGIALASRAETIAERRMVAGQLAEMKLQEMVLTEQWQTGDTQGTFGEEWPEYQWEMKTQTWDGDSMQMVSVIVRFNVQDRPYFVELCTLVEETEES